MVKLIVDEGGARRAFRMGKGILTVGSGAEARLRLASTAVAEIHFELELGEGGVKLRLRPGVLPPKVGGLPAKSELVLAPGARVELGGAQLWIESEEAPTGSAVAPAPARPGGARSAPAAEPSERFRQRRAEAEGARRPAWIAPVLILAATGIVFLVWLRVMKTGAKAEGLATNKLRAAEQALAQADFRGARLELEGIPPDALEPAQIARRLALIERIASAEAEVAAHMQNESGTRYADSLLKKYEGLYLQGKPEPAKVRLFLKRCRVFRERWPTHPEMDWVERQERRFAGYVDLNAPPTWEDVSWEVADLTDSSPRNYVAALALLDELLTRVEGEEEKKARNLRDDVLAGRAEYAQDRLEQARYEFERKEDPSKAVWWLVHNIAWLGDEALANQNARFLVKMPNLEGHLLGYRQDYPERYAAVMRNPIVAAWAKEVGFAP